MIYAAGQYGLRVIMPLSDNYDFYHGGKYDILRFTGVSQANKGAQFFTNQYALNAFTASYIPAGSPSAANISHAGLRQKASLAYERLQWQAMG